MPVGSEHLEQMPKRRSYVGSRAPAMWRASTMQQVPVKETINKNFADVGNAGLLSREPMREMGNAAEIALDRRSGITAIGQILNVSFRVAGQR